MSGVLRVDGFDIRDDSGPVRLRGVNLGNWMLIESYMIGLPWTEHKMRRQFAASLGPRRASLFFAAFMDASLADDDFAFLRQCGFSMVRLPFNYRHFEDDLRPGEYKEEAFRRIDRVIALCRKHGLYVMLDLHAAPGSQARDWNAESAFGESLFWEHRNFQRRTYDLWTAIAARYKNEEAVCGYVPLEEPVAADLDLFHEVNLNLIGAIRKTGDNHIIYLECNNWAKEIASLRDEVFSDPDVVPSIHHYHGQFPPFDKLENYPGTYDGKKYGRAELLRTMDGTFDLKRVKRPVMVGEFGFFIPHPHEEAQYAMTADLVAYFEEMGFHWALWGYKDIGRMGLLSPSPDTPWMRFLNRDDVQAVRELTDKCAAAAHQAVMAALPQVTGDAMENLGREFTRDLHAVILPHIVEKLGKATDGELTELAQSFAFSNCVKREKMIELLSGFAKKSKVR